MLDHAGHDGPMLRRGFLSLSLVSLFAATAIPLRSEPANLAQAKQAILTYVDSGDYAREIAAVVHEAEAWLTKRAQRRAPREAVVFDVDETLLSNLPIMRRLDFGYVPAQWDEWTAAGNAPAIRPAVELYRTARKLGFGVIVLTGRRERDREGTDRNLRAIGCDGWSVSRYKPDDLKISTGEFKRLERLKLAAEGWVLVANIGDQDSDFLGGGVEKNFKLPDPFYVTK